MSQARRSRRATQVKALLSLGLLTGFGAVSTLAAWTGTATATAELHAGTVGIAVGGSAATASPSYELLPSGALWYPGLSQATTVVVKNTGTLAAPYSITGTVTESGAGTLGNALSVRVTSGSVTGTPPNASCDGPEVTVKPAGGPFLAPVIRPVLPPSVGTDTLCVQYLLPTSAVNGLQGNSTSVKLTFTATIGS